MSETSPKFKLLIVDDDPMLRSVVSKTFSKDDLSLETAEDGEVGLARALSFLPDIVVADVMMPRVDGLEMIRRLRREPALQGCYVIFLTAKDRTRDMLDGFDVQADDYVTKPFNLAELRARVLAGGRLKRTQDELRRTNEQLQKALREQAQLLGLAVHDLRNPVHIIQNYISLLGQGVISPEQIREVCARRAIEVSRMIDNILDLARIDAGLVRLMREKVDLAGLLGRARELYQPVAERKTAKLTSVCPGGLTITGDPTRLTEIVNTLLENAIRLSRDQDEIALVGWQEEKRWGVAVSLPTGGSLDKCAAEIFNLAGRSRNLPAGVDASVVLGFAIVSKLVRIMDGEVLADLDPATKRPRFGFQLPSQPSSQEVPA